MVEALDYTQKTTKTTGYIPYGPYVSQTNT